MYQQGLYIYEETLQHHAYVLLSQLLAMHEFENLAYYPGCADVVSALMGVGEPELNRNIMSLAALSRANDDARGGLAIHLEQAPKGVGVITKNGGGDEVLSAREACNKIIHNTAVKLEFEATTEHPLYADAYKLNSIEDNKEYRVPFLILSGKAQGVNGKEWLARINMIQWIFAVANFGA
ncbi:hypothetical protein SAMN04515618_12026 [Collimonas sp. OK307]|uniref:hypothetical protein n=1 Tax=Collimonas sp. OK307 TaxID=1801620 RepID=UPI0008E76001|nr:hypothetical protein [Collimonas sp. OK307]SFI37697.1 hypothetical protein SAMN04515618_12026 [Collimonas sp. OK307]